MNKYDLALIERVTASAIRARLLLQLEGTDANDDPVLIRGVRSAESVYGADPDGVVQRWNPLNFGPSGISSRLGELSGSAEVTTPNDPAAPLLPYLMDRVDGPQSITNFRVSVLLAVFDPETSGLVADTTLQLLGAAVDSAAVANGNVTIRCSAPGGFDSRPYPPRRYFKTCQWVYGGAGCIIPGGPAIGLLPICNHTTATVGGCGDTGTVAGAGTTRLALGLFGGFIINAADL